MTPIEAQAALARMIHARATTDDVAYAVGRFIGAAVGLADAVGAAAASWLRMIGGQR